MSNVHFQVAELHTTNSILESTDSNLNIGDSGFEPVVDSSTTSSTNEFGPWN